MKTGGTSIRRQVESALGAEAVYPNSHDLEFRDRGFYPSPRELKSLYERRQLHGASVIFGHVPCVLSDELTAGVTTAAVLRDPFDRTISILEHRRRRTPSMRGLSYAELLDNSDFVQRQVRDYQTKVFAFDSVDECPQTVDVPLKIDSTRFQRAVERLGRVGILGIAEEMSRMSKRLGQHLGLELGAPPRANAGSYAKIEVDPELEERIRELTQWDADLYNRARRILRE